MLCYYNIYTGAPQGGQGPGRPPNFRLVLLPPPPPPPRQSSTIMLVCFKYFCRVSTSTSDDAVKQATCLQLKYPQLCTYTRVCPQELIITSRTCGNSTACVCYLNWKPVEPPPPPPPPPKQTDGPVGKAGLEL